MKIKPIKTDADHRAALVEIDRLMDAETDSADGDRLDVLATLVEAYEAKRFPIDPPDPVAAIEFCMDQQGLTRKDLEPMIGGRGRVSEVLSGRRPLSLAMIRRLHRGLGIPAEVLLKVAPRRAGARRKASKARPRQGGCSARRRPMAAEEEAEERRKVGREEFYSEKYLIDLSHSIARFIRNQ